MRKQWTNRISAWIVTTVVAQCFAATAMAATFNFNYQISDGIKQDYPGLRDCSEFETRTIHAAYLQLMHLFERGVEEQSEYTNAPWESVDYQQYFERLTANDWKNFTKDASAFDHVLYHHQDFYSTFERMGDLLALPKQLVAKCSSSTSDDLGIRPRDLPPTIIYDARSFDTSLSIAERTKSLIKNTIYAYFQLFLRQGEKIPFYTNAWDECTATMANTYYREDQNFESIISPINYSAYLGALYDQEAGRDTSCSSVSSFTKDVVDPVDSDGDAVFDLVDNCPDTINPFQQDIDMDGIGLACDSEYSLEAKQRRARRSMWNHNPDKTFKGELASCSGGKDFQPVETYDGSKEVSIEFVNVHQSPVGQLQWNDDLEERYYRPGDIADERWCSGTMISYNLFLTAAHCFEAYEGSGFPINNSSHAPAGVYEAADNMHVSFYHQENRDGGSRTEVNIPVQALLEYSKEYDYAILMLEKMPPDYIGFTTITDRVPTPGDVLTIIQHPEGGQKVVDTGYYDGIEDTEYFNIFEGYMRHKVDSLPGSSGSGILNSNGELVGIHTNGGCTVEGGANHGEYMSTLIAVSPLLQGRYLDSDSDGRPDLYDNCPMVSNAGQWDKDKDGVGNVCDLDIDGDSIRNFIDNCPWKANPGQWDKDGDNIGNECDGDIDGDGFSNDAEYAAGSKAWQASSTPLNP